MDTKTKRTIIFVIGMAVVIGVLSTITYAFFSPLGETRTQEAVISTGDTKVTFADGDTGITGELAFGQSITKKFTITNTGTTISRVNMFWDGLVNTYIEGSLTYTLSYSTDRDGEYKVVRKESDVPKSASPTKKILASSLTIPAGATYYYNLTITLNYLEDVNQTADLKAKFYSSFAIEGLNVSDDNVSKMMIPSVRFVNGKPSGDEKIWNDEYSSKITKIVFENTLTPKTTTGQQEVISFDMSENQDGSVMSYLLPDTQDSTKYVAYIQADGKIRANEDSSGLFAVFTNLETIENLGYLDTGSVRDMRRMFQNCSNLTELDLSEFETSNVTDMGWMFYGCSSLTELNISNFNTDKVTNMKSMFNNCNKLTTLDVSNFDTSNAINMSYMFYGCNNLTDLSVSNFDTSNVTNMRSMFSECSKLTILDVSNFDTTNVVDMGWMFNICNSLTTLDVSNFSTNKVINMRAMFQSCSNLTMLDINVFDTSNVVDMGYMFFNCNSLTVLDVSNFNTSNVTDMGSMFYNCRNLTTLDLSNFDTTNVTNMETMFYNCSSLTVLDVSDFDTSKVTDMGAMFNGCNKLTILDVGNFDTSNVTDMSTMFFECNKLTTLDVSNFNTSKVTDMGSMFHSCSNLTTLDLSNFDTSNVTNMFAMFYNCNKLSTLDISNFDTSNVIDMVYMFQNNNALKTTITIRNTNIEYMFMFSGAATATGAQITVNYTKDTSSLVDSMIGTKSSNSNIVKGSLVA